MFGAQYFGQEDAGGVVTEYVVTTASGGGGWTHRGPVTLPKRRKDALGGLPKLPTIGKLPKPPYNL